MRRSSPQKGSCIQDLTAQASGQALIKGSESAGSATRSVFPSIRRPVTLLFSTLLHLCVYLQPADLSVPSLLCLRICSVPHTIRGRCLPSLPPLQKKRSLFHQPGFLLGLFCILIKILCVFACVCGLTTYYFNSRGALAITFVRLCVLQMWSADDLLKPKFLHQLRKRALSEGTRKTRTDKNGGDGKKRRVKTEQGGWGGKQAFGRYNHEFNGRETRKSSMTKWKERRQWEWKTGATDEDSVTILELTNHSSPLEP